jgi:hypothetical protein
LCTHFNILDKSSAMYIFLKTYTPVEFEF